MCTNMTDNNSVTSRENDLYVLEDGSRRRHFQENYQIQWWALYFWQHYHCWKTVRSFLSTICEQVIEWWRQGTILEIYVLNQIKQYRGQQLQWLKWRRQLLNIRDFIFWRSSCILEVKGHRLVMVWLMTAEKVGSLLGQVFWHYLHIEGDTVLPFSCVAREATSNISELLCGLQ